MRLLVCRLCPGNEPFACPSRFRRTYMQLHLEKAHGMSAEEMEMTRRHSPQSGPVLWSAGAGRDRKLVLEEVFLPVPGLPKDGDTAGQEAAEKAGQGYLEDNDGTGPARPSVRVAETLPAASYAIPPDSAKQLAAAYKAQFLQHEA